MSEVDFPKWICHNQSQAKKGWLKKHAGTVEGPNIEGGHCRLSIPVSVSFPVQRACGTSAPLVPRVNCSLGPSLEVPPPQFRRPWHPSEAVCFPFINV